MFEEGTILYFDPFYFKNGNPAKPKYFVVWKNLVEAQILASLPTRSDSIPRNEEVDQGCVELPEINLNCFVISEKEIITECGKRFDFKTHLYGHQLDLYEKSLLEELYPLEGTDYVIWGKMIPEYFKALIQCFTQSKIVKRKYKRMLQN